MGWGACDFFLKVIKTIKKKKKKKEWDKIH